MKIIVTAAGGSGGRFLTEALQMAGHYVIGTDCDPWRLPLAISEEKHLVPTAGCGTLFVGRMAGLVGETEATLIMPQSDAEASDLAAAKTVPTFLPSHETIGTAQDKWHSYARWIRYPDNAMTDTPAPTVPTPATFRVGGGMQAEVSQEWPFLLKARHGAGGKYMLRPKTVGQANAWIALYPDVDFLGQEWIDGVNCVADLVFWRGELVAWAGREVLAWQMAHCAPAGITGASSVTVLYLREELRDVAVAAVRALPGEPHGVFGVDTIRKEDGSYWVTEVNAGRFNAPGPAFYARAGFNLANRAAIMATSDYGMAEFERDFTKDEPLVWAMLRGQDVAPVYLTREEWENITR